METKDDNDKLSCCRNGHPRTLENTYFPPGRSPVCRVCNKLAAAKYKAKKYGRRSRSDRSESDVPKSIKDLFRYCEKSPSGLVWLINSGSRARAGKPAGAIIGKGYYCTRHMGVSYRCHRIVWELHNGPIPSGMLIDHINGVKTDNRIQNLRLATKAQNGHNQVRHVSNTTGVKGLTRNAHVWQGQIWDNGTRHTYASKNRLEVEAWLKRTRIELHGEYARHQ